MGYIQDYFDMWNDPFFNLMGRLSEKPLTSVPS